MKRSADELSAGVQKKRQKLRLARNIASESSSPALRDGQLPIAQFVAARSFEIKALTEAMKKSREAVNRRAFQTLPRHMRRRAASHNVKKLPKRLRDRARAEMAETDQSSRRKGAPYGRKRGRKQTMQKLLKLQQQMETSNLPVEPELIPGTQLQATKPINKGKFMKRQRDKTWLPSHLHTSKRGKMEVKWGYAIPISPNEKTYRAMHRASRADGAVIFDTSYQGHILLKGATTSIAEILETMTLSKVTCGKRAQRGQRTFDGHIYMDGLLLCPTTLLWDGATDDPSSVLISLHPAVYADVWKLILREKEGRKLQDLKVIDMRFQIGSITLVGPRSIDAIISVLRPEAINETLNECAKALASYHGIRPESLAPNLILSFCVDDPRQVSAPKLINDQPKHRNEFLNRDPEVSSTSGLFSLQATDACNRHEGRCSAVPIILHHNELGLTVLAPWQHITHIWHLLNHLPGVRWGGLQELSQLHYEKRLPHFPVDYPGTTAGNQEALVVRKQREHEYLRRPPAKRLNHAKAINGKPEIGDPFTCDFDYLINASAAESTLSDLSHVSVSVLDKSSGMDTTADVSMEDMGGAMAPLYTSTPQVPDTVADSLPKQDQSFGKINDANTTPTLSSSRARIVPRLFLASQRASLSEEQLACGLVQVCITMKKRGNPQSCARIYHSPNGTLIGFMTTGNFSLCLGKAAGLGCILMSHAKQYAGKGKQGCFVRDVGQKDFYEANWSFIQ